MKILRLSCVVIAVAFGILAIFGVGPVNVWIGMGIIAFAGALFARSAGPSNSAHSSGSPYDSQRNG